MGPKLFLEHCEDQFKHVSQQILWSFTLHCNTGDESHSHIYLRQISLCEEHFYVRGSEDYRRAAGAWSTSGAKEHATHVQP